MKTSLNSYYCTWNGHRQPTGSVKGENTRAYMQDMINRGLSKPEQFRVFGQYGELERDLFLNGTDKLKT